MRTYLIAVLLLTMPDPVLGQANPCTSIRDPDLRRQCFAEKDREPATCTGIRDPDQRAMCRLRSRRW